MLLVYLSFCVATFICFPCVEKYNNRRDTPERTTELASVKICHIWLCMRAREVNDINVLMHLLLSAAGALRVATHIHH